MKYCEVCQDRRFIRLPLRRSGTLWDLGDANAAVIGHRDFPCPECSEQVSIDCVQVLQVHAARVADINDPRFLEHVRSALARQIAGQLYEHGIIAYQEGPLDRLTETYPTRATLGVVRPEIVATMEQRATVKQEEMAAEVVEAAIKRFSTWGPEHIPKGVAIGDLKKAFEDVRARRAAGSQK